MFTSLEIKTVAGLACAAAILTGLVLFDAHERQLGAVQARADAAEQHVRDIDTARAKDAQIQATQEAADHEADNFRVQAALDAHDAHSAGDGLQQRFAAVNAGCLSDHPAASAASPAASDAATLRADVLRRVVEAAQLAASTADAAHGAGRQAECDYDALSGVCRAP